MFFVDDVGIAVLISAILPFQVELRNSDDAATLARTFVAQYDLLHNMTEASCLCTRCQLAAHLVICMDNLSLIVVLPSVTFCFCQLPLVRAFEGRLANMSLGTLPPLPPPLFSTGSLSLSARQYCCLTVSMPLQQAFLESQHRMQNENKSCTLF